MAGVYALDAVFCEEDEAEKVMNKAREEAHTPFLPSPLSIYLSVYLLSAFVSLILIHIYISYHPSFFPPSLHPSHLHHLFVSLSLIHLTDLPPSLSPSLASTFSHTRLTRV